MTFIDGHETNSVTTTKTLFSRRSVLKRSAVAAVCLGVGVAAPMTSVESSAGNSPEDGPMLSIPQHEDFLGGV